MLLYVLHHCLFVSGLCLLAFAGLLLELSLELYSPLLSQLKLCVQEVLLSEVYLSFEGLQPFKLHSEVLVSRIMLELQGGHREGQVQQGKARGLVLSLIHI